MQVCVQPSYQKQYSTLSYSSVNSYGTNGTLMKSGGGTITNHLWTEKDQSVFEVLLSRPIDLKAIIIYINDQEIIYSIKGKKLTENWTEWTDPYTQNDRNDHSWFKLVYGKEIKINPISPVAPSIRYRLTGHDKYLRPIERIWAGIKDTIPPC